ncbi:MAG TPA: hypothetical protein PLT20_14325, partial [Sedimentisphaerales bacterium]|nr:hypothetical protein [Sedimentisphaerales bacterium]
MKSNVIDRMLCVSLVFLLAVCVWGAAEEQDLIAILKSNADTVEKCAACQQLRICGTVQSVAALASML